MAAALTPHTFPHPASRPTRPALQLVPGGRRAARTHVRQVRRSGVRVHPSVLLRRRLLAILVVTSVVVVAYLAITGARALVTGPPTSGAIATTPIAAQTAV